MRCGWAKEEIEINYHDNEWGREVHDDRVLFEFLVLESAQAGLNWITILKKRENYRVLYDNFDYEVVAKYDEDKFNELIMNPGIIRNRLKIRASINNAIMFIKVREEFGSFDKYIWSFSKRINNQFKVLEEVPASSDLSDEICKDMKKRGFKFIGTTIIYAYLQATGVINDHLVSCPFY